MREHTSSRPLHRFRVLLDRGLTAANVLDLACESHPDSPVFHLDAELPYRRLPGREITVQALKSFVCRVGNGLLAAGLRRHDRVAIFKTNGPDYFFLALAVIRAGGIAVPINPGMSIASLRHYLAHTGAAWVITDAEQFQRVPGDPALLPGVRRWVFPDAPPDFPVAHIDLNQALEEVSDELEPVPLARDSDVLIVHTSGTTGFPKGVISTSGGLVRGIKGHYLSEPITTRNRIAVAGHYNHLVYYLGFYTSLLGNFQTWTVSRLEAGHVLRVIAEARIQIFFAFPDIYLALLQEGLAGHDLSSVRIWIATADTSHEIHMQAFCREGAFLRLFGTPVVRSLFVEALGTSEVGSAALRRVQFSFSKLRFRRKVGRPTLGGPKVKVADEEGRPLPRGRVGRLMVKGGTLFKGYWNDHAMLHPVMRDGWWWTGDLAYKDRLGRYYHMDRAADVIHTARGPVYTLLVEEVLLGHPDVAEAAVFGLPHPGEGQDGEIAFCLVQPKPGRTVDPEACRAWANGRLPSPGIAEVRIVAEEEIPRGLTGKVLKRVLRERYSGSAA
jgi:acyl-coenzyme A synthetase/AMP-(fatty) acid ligase